MQDARLLQAIELLTQRMDTRFDRVDEKFEKLDDRTRKVESDITKIKTAGGIVTTILTFVGWTQVKPWLTSLMK